MTVVVAHTGFIVAAFAITAVVLGATVLAVVFDYRAQRRAIARLTGATRGSEP